ncbi:MAG: efflux RND transporter permease subunit, partial [Desulfuromonadales bacterium]
MLEHIIDWSIKNKFLVVLVTFFVIIGGLYTVFKTPVDAIPDLSDVQVIVFTEYKGQAPQVVEDQVTYPLTTQMLAVPGAEVVRGYSYFSAIFEDDVDERETEERIAPDNLGPGDS